MAIATAEERDRGAGLPPTDGGEDAAVFVCFAAAIPTLGVATLAVRKE